MAPRPSQVSEEQVQRAASELASQEFYNPGWCKPGDPLAPGKHQKLYKRRARLILEAAAGER